jgi:hypothetical protein
MTVDAIRGTQLEILRSARDAIEAARRAFLASGLPAEQAKLLWGVAAKYEAYRFLFDTKTPTVPAGVEIEQLGSPWRLSRMAGQPAPLFLEGPYFPGRVVLQNLLRIRSVKHVALAIYDQTGCIAPDQFAHTWLAKGGVWHQVTQNILDVAPTGTVEDLDEAAFDVLCRAADAGGRMTVEALAQVLDGDDRVAVAQRAVEALWIGGFLDRRGDDFCISQAGRAALA